MKLEKTGSSSIIQVEPTDDCDSVIRLVRTQSKQVVIVLPEHIAAFRSPADFRELQRLKRVFQAQITLVIAGSVSFRVLAHRYGLSVYPSLDALFATTPGQTPVYLSDGRAAPPAVLSRPCPLPADHITQGQPAGLPPNVSSSSTSHRRERKGSASPALDALLALLLLGFLGGVILGMLLPQALPVSAGPATLLTRALGVVLSFHLAGVGVAFAALLLLLLRMWSRAAGGEAISHQCNAPVHVDSDRGSAPPLLPSPSCAATGQRGGLAPAFRRDPSTTAQLHPLVSPSTSGHLLGLAAAPLQAQGSSCPLGVGAASDPGIKWEKRPNQDTIGSVLERRRPPGDAGPFGLFAVADGMGGHNDGRDASRQAIQTLSETVVPKVAGEGDPGGHRCLQLLADGVQAANRAVYQRNQERGGDAGTTITAALIIDSTAYIANVGDSRTYLYRAGEGLTRVTVDHSQVERLIQRGEISRDEAYTHPDRNLLYRRLGGQQEVTIDTFTAFLRVGDALVLCSDGLWGLVRDQHIERIVRDCASHPSAAGQALVAAALQAGGPDNISAVVVYRQS